MLEPIIMKLWNLLINVQYDNTLLKLVPQTSLLPLKMNIYETVIPFLIKGLGIYYHDDYYVAKRPMVSTYKK